MHPIIKCLRDRRSFKRLATLPNGSKVIEIFKLNKEESFICWERWHSLPNNRNKAVLQNSYLSLRDISIYLKLNS